MFIDTINNCKSRNAKISFKANFAHKYCISQCGAKNNHNNSNNNSINNNQICAGINLQNAIYQIHIVKCASQNPLFWLKIVDRYMLECFFFEHGLSNWFCNYICIEIMKCWIVSSSPTSWKIWKLISILSKGDVINSWCLFHCGSANVSS